MGGKALKNVETRRYQREEYLAIEKEVLEKINAIFPNSRCEPIPAYHTKPSFGDMDIVIEHLESKKELEKHLESLGVDEIFKNSDCWSTNYKDFQVDYIFVESKYYDSVLDYFSYNDIGNLLGRISRRFGFKLGQLGLNHVLLEKTTMLEDINVTSNYSEALEFLGYDSKRFKQGFETLEDMFDYVIQSEAFDPTVFALEGRNHDARTRDAKRPNYNKFLKYIEDKEFPNVEEIDKEKQLKRAFGIFPEFKEKYDAVFDRLRTKALIKEKFNGKIISNLTEYKGIQLGLFYHYLESEKSKIDDFSNFIIGMDKDAIESFIKLKDIQLNKDVGYKNFTTPKIVKRYLLDNNLLNESQLKKLKNAFNTKHLMKKANELNQPIALINAGMSYAFNIGTYVAFVNEKFKLNLKSEKMEALTKKFNPSRYDVIKSENDIERILESLSGTRDRDLEKQKLKKQKPRHIFGNINELFTKNKDKTIMSFDIEMYEVEHTKTTEIGFSIIKNGVQENRHFIIEENIDLRNGKYVEDNKDNFNFGESEVLPFEEAKSVLLEYMDKSDYLVGNAITEDLRRLLSDKEIDLHSRKAINTENMVSHIDNSVRKPLSIKKLLDYFNVDYKNLHNAGNDSYYNLNVIKRTLDVFDSDPIHKERLMSIEFSKEQNSSKRKI
jgi:hypothetical protein